MKRTISFLAISVSLFLFRGDKASAQDVIYTDADAGAKIICRNDQTADACFAPLGEEIDVRVHDQNNLLSGYWHFDLSDLDSQTEVLEARFQLDLQSNSWSDTGTSVSVFAIVDPAKDWDLGVMPENEIVGAIAPQSDFESYSWTGDPNDPQQRFNAPTPFLEEGNLPSSTVRLLEELIIIPGTDALTSGDPGDPGNEYGGYANGDPASGGSSDDGDTPNPWPIKNAVDIDVTELIQWKLGQQPAYSDFDPLDSDLTIVVRTDTPDAGDNGFARFIAKESPFLGGPLNLEPGRISLDLGVTGLTCDFDASGVCDIADIDALLYQGQAQQIVDPYDLNSDGVVNLADRDAWYVAASAANGVELVPGDTNLDGRVVPSDLNALGTNWQRTDATSIAQGDFNGDGLVAAADLNAIGLYWQHGVAAAANTAVPESSCGWALLATWAMWLVTGRRRSNNGQNSDV